MTGHERAFHTDVDYYADRAEGLLASARDGTPTAVGAFERERCPLTPAGARKVVARSHGLPTWAALRTHVARILAEPEPFARAFQAIEAHDPAGLETLLDLVPGLVGEEGTNGNDLLGLATATCDERLVALLLDRGADVAHSNAHGWTALHQACSSGLVQLTALLLERGAPVDGSARGDGGTALVAGLFWGKRATTELVAERSIAPGNLRVAAGLGRLELLDALVGEDGRLARAATAHRGFVRPHSGFPAWRPSDDHQEVVDEALAWAARNDRGAAVELLVARGARLEADVYRGTALAWAAATSGVEAVRTLLALGADPNGRTTFGGPDHGEAATPLHLAAQDGDDAVVDVLLAAGADPTLRDGRHDSTPGGWAEHGGHPEMAARLGG